MKVLIAATLLVPGLALAQATPAGLWKTIDDDGKTVKSHVRIVDNGGVFSATIDKALDPKSKPTDVCDKCKDDRKDKPIVGLEIMRGVKADGEGVWGGATGEVLDPENGKTYRVRLKPVDGGKKLEVRGYIGAPLFGRSQTWLRVEPVNQ